MKYQQRNRVTLYYSSLAHTIFSLFSPLQFPAERRKRDRSLDSSLNSPPGSTDSTRAGMIGLGSMDEESPATKRAKVGLSHNFLAAHADAIKNKQRNRVRNGGKMDLKGLKTEKESKLVEPSSSVDTDMAHNTSAGTPLDSASHPPPVIAPSISSVLSRFTHPLHFKYNEGCTNAVRRTVQVAHFLPL